MDRNIKMKESRKNTTKGQNVKIYPDCVNVTVNKVHRVRKTI